MPGSVFSRPQELRSDEGDTLTVMRERLIAAGKGNAADLPLDASTCFVWPSAYCPVGCGHCSYASPRIRDATRRSIVDDPALVLGYIEQMRPTTVVLSGGGEPMTEPGFCEFFVEHVDSSRLREIQLITSAHFATSRAAAAQAIGRFVGAWRRRSSGLADVRLSIRLSVDWFHAQRIGVEPAAHVVRVLREPQYADVGLRVRSVRLQNDTTIDQLAAALGADLGPMGEFRSRLTWGDGLREVVVTHKNLIFDGRMNRVKLARLPVRVPEGSATSSFVQTIRERDGRYVAARVYDGPDATMLDGLFTVIEDDGGIKVLDGQAPDRTPTIWSEQTWANAIRELYDDPVTRLLVRQGADELARLMEAEYPGSVALGAEMNQLFYLVDPLLRDERRRLYATLRAMEELEVQAPPELIAEAWDRWRNSHG
jgi:hypothetical protein